MVPLDAAAAVGASAAAVVGAASAGALVGAAAEAAVGADAAGAAVGAAPGWLVELPQAATAPANTTARIAIQIRRYIELVLLPNDNASLVAVSTTVYLILASGRLIWDEKSMRGFPDYEKRFDGAHA